MQPLAKLAIQYGEDMVEPRVDPDLWFYVWQRLSGRLCVLVGSQSAFSSWFGIYVRPRGEFMALGHGPYLRQRRLPYAALVSRRATPLRHVPSRPARDLNVAGIDESEVWSSLPEVKTRLWQAVSSEVDRRAGSQSPLGDRTGLYNAAIAGFLSVFGRWLHAKPIPYTRLRRRHASPLGKPVLGRRFPQTVWDCRPRIDDTVFQQVCGLARRIRLAAGQVYSHPGVVGLAVGSSTQGLWVVLFSETPLPLPYRPLVTRRLACKR